eukprot:g14022.t1
MGKGEFLKGEGTVGPEAIAGKHLGLYFSAHWCPPCRAFTPQLAKWYAGVKKELGDKFEIVFCSGDRDDENWCALPFDRKDDLDGIYKIEGIPTFLIVDQEGNIVTKAGRSLVGRNAPASEFPWAPPVIQELDNPDEQGINDKPTLCLMLESVPIANQSDILAKAIQFLVARQPSSASATIRAVCGLESVETVSKTDRSEVSSARGAPKAVRTLSVDTPWIILLDCPDGGGYYTGKMAKEMDGSGVEAMLEGWKGKTLERKQLK